MESTPENNQFESEETQIVQTQENQQEPTPAAATSETTQTPPAPPEPPTPQNTLTTPHHHNHSQKQRHKHTLVTVIIITLLATSLVSAASLYSVYTLNTQVTTLQNQLQTIAAQIQTSGSGTTTATYTSTDSLSALYNNAIDSVVTIECEIIQTYNLPFRGQQSVTSTAQGSGFVAQYNGQYIIVTNNHVIADASTITVTFADGNTYTATVVGADSSTDLAILKCTDAPTSQYHALTFTSSANANVGDAVVAIGSPYGLSGTMTTGIISALDRTITATDESTGTTEEITGLLQTSAPINSGNSGGPLLTYDGKVIGITTAIVSNSDGLGFAVPSDTIQNFIQQTLK
jgi:putative serine protease PepD